MTSLIALKKRMQRPLDFIRGRVSCSVPNNVSIHAVVVCVCLLNQLTSSTQFMSSADSVAGLILSDWGAG